MGLRKFTGMDSTCKFVQGKSHADHVVVSLAHAHDYARAKFHAGIPHGLQRGHAVLVGVRRADLGVVAFAGIQVVIHPVDAAGLELLGPARESAGPGRHRTLRLKLRLDLRARSA